MIVMKFGGTSVEDARAIARCCAVVQARLDRQPVVVVSALAKVTDALLQAASSAALGEDMATTQVIDSLLQRHQATARDLLHRPDDVLLSINSLFAELRRLLSAICALRELTPRLSDRVVSFGELLSSAIFSEALREIGVAGSLVDARDCIITDEHFGAAVPRIDESNDHLRAHLLPLLKEDKVPVLGGFVASNGKGVTTTLGRGGSDFTAALVGAALQADRVEIWTDVDGIRTTDPRLYSKSRHVENLSFHEAAELAHFGAKVLHPATLLPAIDNNIPVHVLNSRNPEHPGTCVKADSSGPARVKAIAVKRGIILVEASAPRSLKRRGLARELFSLLEQHGCTPDIASISDTNVTVAIDKKDLVPLVCNGLGPRVTVHAENSKALISLVAEGIRGIPNLPSQVFRALDGLDVRLISQGASRWSFSVIVSESDVSQAVQRLHQNLLENTLPAGCSEILEPATA